MRDTFALAQHLGYLIVLSTDCSESPKNSTKSLEIRLFAESCPESGHVWSLHTFAETPEGTCP